MCVITYMNKYLTTYSFLSLRSWNFKDWVCVCFIFLLIFCLIIWSLPPPFPNLINDYKLSHCGIWHWVTILSQGPHFLLTESPSKIHVCLLTYCPALVFTTVLGDLQTWENFFYLNNGILDLLASEFQQVFNEEVI